MNHVKRLQKGFTLIELLLAMMFLSTLLLAIALTIVQISAIYNRGETVKEVNQVGLALGNEFTTAINASAPFALTGSTSHYVAQGNWGGRLCLGQYSYIWNYGLTLDSSNPNGINSYSSGTDKIGLVKVSDPGGSYCANPAKPVDPSSAVELVDIGQHALAIHQLTITSGSGASDPVTGEQLYTVNFTIGTNDCSDTNDCTLMTNGDGYVTGCKPPGTSGADPVYCVVQQFSIVARAGNGA